MLRKSAVWVLLIAVLAACVPTPIPAANAYLALVPARMYTGERQAISLSLWADDRPASGWVEVSLHKGGR